MKITVIGAGPGGYVAAIRAAQMGAQVTVIENDELGGTCLNRGCIPTKTLISSAEAYVHANRFSELGIELPGAIGFNLARIRERKDKVVSIQVKGIKALFKSWGITLIKARGTLLSPDVVRSVRPDGTTQDIKSDRLIIATGSRPARIPLFNFDHESVMTSDDAVLMNNIPRSLLIIGAGYIGCEFAFLYRAFGAEVTIIDLLPRVLATEDREISEIIEREFKKSKIQFLPNTKLESAVKSPDGMIVSCSNGREIKAEKVLVSIGRSMNSEQIGLEPAGVRTGPRHEVLVNDKMETNVPGMYAIGDVTGTIMLAHVASQQGMCAAENAMGGDKRMDYRSVPSGIFTMPEIGSVGVREYQAIEKGMKVKVGRYPFRGLGRAHAMDAIVGLVKIIADAETDKVIGMHICGAHATDLVHEGVLAIQKGITAQELGDTIHAHPTFAEAVREAAQDIGGSAIHVLRPE